MKIHDKDNGLEELKRKLEASKRALVTVGIHAAEGAVAADMLDSSGNRVPSDAVSVIQLAEWHEFGIGNPQRSFIRDAVDEQEAELKKKFKASVLASLRPGGRPLQEQLSRFGLYVVGLIQQRMADGLQPGLAESTEKGRARKGQLPPYKPLICTGQLRSSIRSKTEVGT